MSNYVSSDSGFKIAPYLRILNEAFQLDDDNIVDKFRGVYGFKVKRKDGAEGYWVVNVKEGKGSVEFNSKTKPDVTFIINDEDMVELARGNLAPQKAFFSNIIKVQGNMGAAMKLTQIPTVIKAELDKIRSKL